MLNYPSMPDILLSPSGLEKLRRELEELKGPVRVEVAAAIREAKAHGDLRENAAYHEAKLNQTRLESRIADLEKVLQIAKVVERPPGSDSEAHLGSKVELEDLTHSARLSVTLVGSYEADPMEDLYSITSPLGSALLGHSPGEEVDVDAPAGIIRYRILSVE